MNLFILNNEQENQAALPMSGIMIMAEGERR